jgi:hypothetical protein
MDISCTTHGSTQGIFTNLRTTHIKMLNYLLIDINANVPLGHTMRLGTPCLRYGGNLRCTVSAAGRAATVYEYCIKCHQANADNCNNA